MRWTASGSVLCVYLGLARTARGAAGVRVQNTRPLGERRSPVGQS